MFVYLSKKIAIPNNTRLKCVSWNSEQGWIACGGENGLLKVLKLESQVTRENPQVKGLAAPSNLSMNQSLEGHTGPVMVATWNENYRKLTTSDGTGLIIVWMMYKGMWYEEMINNRNKSVVRDMKWTSDGQKICIVYEDGAVIVGSVDGNRIWGKELTKITLHHVEWSPDGGRQILFCSDNGEVHIYDSTGNFISKLPIYCIDYEKKTSIVGIHWYDGREGYVDPTAPSLAVCFENGKAQLMRHTNDDKPILIDTGMKTIGMKWNPAGSVLAISGQQNEGDMGSQSVQFYTPFGQHLRTLKVPGTNIHGISWEGGGLRIGLAVDSFIYFANIHTAYYKWAYFGKTVVYAFTKPDRPEHCVIFWDIKTDERYVKYVKKLLSIRAAGDNCVLVTKTDDNSEQYILILCNSIGTPVDSKYTEVKPDYLAMSKYHVVVASEDKFRPTNSALSWGGGSALDAAMMKKDSKERVFNIDDLNVSYEVGKPEPKRNQNTPSGDSICCITVSEVYMLIGRESGTMHRYVISSLHLEDRFLLKCRPQILSLNCNSSRMSVIDIAGVLCFVDLDPPMPRLPTVSSSDDVPGETQGGVAKPYPGKQLNFERKDVWDMKWADDNPELFAMMEKTRMYIFRGLNPEEPMSSSGSILMDEVMQNPEHPDRDMILRFETKSLRDTRDILANVGIQDAYTFIEDNPHPRLWRLLAENALERLDFPVAERAFVKCADYQGIQFVKRLRILEDKMKQKAEVAAYFKRFNEAENLYREIDRKDLAIELRMRLGDWFRVVQLLQSGGVVADDALLTRAWNEIGDYYAERHKWGNAVQYYLQAKNFEQLAECYYDYTALEELVMHLREGDPLLKNIGEKFVSICEHAVTSFLKGGDVQAAIECCVHLNQWNRAVELAETHTFPQIESLLSKYATHLLEKNKVLHAIELYRKASHHMEAAKLLFQLGKEASTKSDLLRAKQLYVLGALEVEQYRKRLLDARDSNAGDPTTQVLSSLLADAAHTSKDKTLEGGWRGAEAYHFYLLAQRQLYEGYIDASMKTALRLQDYEDIIAPKDIYSLIALTAYYNKHYGQCSKAFIKLETLPDATTTALSNYQDLALEIFVKFPPNDPPTKRKFDCPSCGSGIKDWSTSCAACGVQFPPCVVTGRPILETRFAVCRGCKHKALELEAQSAKFCPLCHHRDGWQV